GFKHAVFLEVAGQAVFRYQPLDMSDAVEARVEGLAAELRTHLVHPPHQSGEARVTEAAVAAAGAVSATGAFEQHDVLVRKSAAQMVSGGKPGEAATDNDDVGLVAALERGVYLLVFEVGRLEPEIVEEVFVKLWRFRRIVAELFKAVGERPCAGCAGGHTAQECASRHFARAVRLRTAETSAHRTFLDS